MKNPAEARRLWGRLILNHRIQRDLTLPCEGGGFEHAFEAATQLCQLLDIPRPIWLEKHERELREFARTAFTREDFIEAVWFDKFELECYGGDEKPKAQKHDPRIEA